MTHSYHVRTYLGNLDKKSQERIILHQDEDYERYIKYLKPKSKILLEALSKRRKIPNYYENK